MNNKRELAFGAIEKLGDGALGHFIAGRAVAGEGIPFDVLEPGTGQVIGHACDASEEQL